MYLESSDSWSLSIIERDGSPGEVWIFYYPYSEFFPPFERILLYIKLKLWIGADGDVGIVMSFHDEGNI
jgi:hypothetical protein